MVAHSHLNCNSRRPDNFFNLCGIQAARGTHRYARARRSYRQNKIKFRKTGFLYSPVSQHPDFSLDLPGSFNLQGRSLPWESVQTLTYTPFLYIYIKTETMESQSKFNTCNNTQLFFIFWRWAERSKFLSQLDNESRLCLGKLHKHQKLQEPREQGRTAHNSHLSTEGS